MALLLGTLVGCAASAPVQPRATVVPNAWLADLSFSDRASEAVSEAVIHLSWSPEHTAQLESLELAPAWGAFSAAEDRRLDWHRVPAAGSPLSLRPGESVRAAAGPLAAGSYVRVMVAVPLVFGLNAAGERLPVTSHIEPIALPVTATQNRSTQVELELAVLSRSPRVGGGLDVFVKDARLRRTN